MPFKMPKAEIEFRRVHAAMTGQTFADGLPEMLADFRKTAPAVVEETLARLRSEAEAAEAAVEDFRQSGRPLVTAGRLTPDYLAVVAAAVKALLKLRAMETISDLDRCGTRVVRFAA